MTAKNSTPFTEADGHQLAVDMLREMRYRWTDEGEDLPDGAPDPWRSCEPDILSRYFEILKSKGSTALEKGFLTVLTDFIGSSINGCVPDPECYEHGAVVD